MVKQNTENDEKTGGEECDCLLCQLGITKSFPMEVLSMGIMGGPPSDFLKKILNRSREKLGFWAEQIEDGPVELVVPLPYHEEVKNLLSLRRNILAIQGSLDDQKNGFMKAFLNGDLEAFDKLSKSSKEKIAGTESTFLQILEITLILGGSDEMKELAAKIIAARNEGKKDPCEDFLICLASGKQGFENRPLDHFFANVKDILLNFPVKVYKKSLVRFREQEKRILAKLPEKYHGVTEVPELRILEKDLPLAIQAFQESKKDKEKTAEKETVEVA